MEQKGKRLCNLNHLSTNIHCKKLHLQSPSCIEDTQSCSLVTFDVHADASYRSVPLSGSDWFADMGLVQTVQWNQKIEALLSCCLAWSSLNWLQSVSVHSVCRDYWQCCCCHCLRTAKRELTGKNKCNYKKHIETSTWQFSLLLTLKSLHICIPPWRLTNVTYCSSELLITNPATEGWLF